MNRAEENLPIYYLHNNNIIDNVTSKYVMNWDLATWTAEDVHVERTKAAQRRIFIYYSIFTPAKSKKKKNWVMNSWEQQNSHFLKQRKLCFLKAMLRVKALALCQFQKCGQKLWGDDQNYVMQIRLTRTVSLTMSDELPVEAILERLS